MKRKSWLILIAISMIFLTGCQVINGKNKSMGKSDIEQMQSSILGKWQAYDVKNKERETRDFYGITFKQDGKVIYQTDKGDTESYYQVTDSDNSSVELHIGKTKDFKDKKDDELGKVYVVEKNKKGYTLKLLRDNGKDVTEEKRAIFLTKKG